MNWFNCDKIGDMSEYIECKLERDYDKMTFKFTQLVILQRPKYQFDLSIVKAPKNHSPDEDIPMKGKHDEVMPKKYQKEYIYGVLKLLHLVKWSIPECLN